MGDSGLNDKKPKQRKGPVFYDKRLPDDWHGHVRENDKWLMLIIFSDKIMYVFGRSFIIEKKKI